MSNITLDQIKELRDRTGISIAQVKTALEEADGDMEAAIEALKKKGAEVARKKSSRALGSGVVRSYIHTDSKIGSIVILACETDFVAKNEDFKNLAYDLAMHIVASDPKDGQELLKQPFVKDPSKTVSDLVGEAIQKFGENIGIAEFYRMHI